MNYLRFILEYPDFRKIYLRSFFCNSFFYVSARSAIFLKWSFLYLGYLYFSYNLASNSMSFFSLCAKN